MADSHIIEGILKKVKEDDHIQVFDLDCHIQGIKGTIYVDKSYLPLFDKLIIEKKEYE